MVSHTHDDLTPTAFLKIRLLDLYISAHTACHLFFLFQVFTVLFNLSVIFFFSMYLFVRFGINNNQIVRIIVAAFGFWLYVMNYQVIYFEFLFGYWAYASLSGKKCP